MKSKEGPFPPNFPPIPYFLAPTHRRIQDALIRQRPHLRHAPRDRRLVPITNIRRRVRTPSKDLRPSLAAPFATWLLLLQTHGLGVNLVSSVDEDREKVIKLAAQRLVELGGGGVIAHGSTWQSGAVG